MRCSRACTSPRESALLLRRLPCPNALPSSTSASRRTLKKNWFSSTPEVIETRGKQTEEEGCLSLPDIREKVNRAAWVKVKAQNEYGEWFEVEGEELLARALLHEIDHLNGVLFIDRISRLKREFVLRKIRKLQEKRRVVTRRAVLNRFVSG